MRRGWSRLSRWPLLPPPRRPCAHETTAVPIAARTVAPAVHESDEQCSGGPFRATTPLLAPSKKRAPKKGTRASAKKTSTDAAAVTSHATNASASVPPSSSSVETGSPSSTPDVSAPSDNLLASAHDMEESTKPAPTEFNPDEPGEVTSGEPAGDLGRPTRSEKQSRAQKRQNTAQTRDVLDTLLVRVNAALSERKPVPVPSRAVPAGAAASADAQETSVVKPFLETPQATWSEPVALTTEEALTHFAECFTATLFRWSPHTASEQVLAAAAAALGPDVGRTLASVAPIGALSGRFHDVMREATWCTPLTTLSHTLMSLCEGHVRSVTNDEEEDEDGERLLPEVFVEKLTRAVRRAATGTGDYVAYLQSTAEQQPQRPHPSSQGSERPAPPYATLVTVLQQVVLELYLAATLLHPDGYLPDTTRHTLRAVGLCLLRHTTEDAEYVFFGRQRGGTLSAAALSHGGEEAKTARHPAPMTVQRVKRKGLAALMQHHWQRQAKDRSGGSGGSALREDRRRREAVDALCALYFVMLPEAIQASHMGPSPAQGEGGEERLHGSSVVGATNGPTAVLAALRDAWEVSAPRVRLGGALAALPWLTLVPHLFSGMCRLTEARLELAVLGDGGNDAAYDASLALAQRHLGDLLQALLLYDRNKHEQQRHAAMALAVGAPSPPREADGTDAAAEEEDGREEATTGLETPRNRNRGKRSLFYHNEKERENSILVGTDNTSARAKPADAGSRFVSRSGGGGRGGRDTGVAHGTGMKGAAAGALAAASSRHASPLLEVMVNAREAVPVLAERYALDRLHRETTVEDCWLSLARALHCLQNTLHAPPAVNSLTEGLKGDRTTRQESPRDQPQIASTAVKSSLAPSHLPERLRTLLESHSAPTRKAQEQRLAAALRVLTQTQALVPLELLDSTLRIMGPLTQALLRLNRVAVQQLQQGTVHFQSKVGAALGLKSPSRGDFVRQQRRLNLVLVLGAQELVWFDGSAWDGVYHTWRMRLAVLPASPAAQSPQSFPRWRAEADRLLLRLADEQALVTSRRRRGQFEQLIFAAREALRVLQEGQDAMSALPDGNTKPSKRRPANAKTSGPFSSAPLSVLAKQSAAAVLLTSLHACVDHSIRYGEQQGKGSGASVTMLSSAARHAELREVFFDFLSVLEADPELTLLCGYPVFLQALYETYQDLARHSGDGAAVRARMYHLVSSHLFPLLLPALVESLHASRGSRAKGATAATDGSSARRTGAGESTDTTVTASHAMQCELALLQLAELSRMGALRRPRDADQSLDETEPLSQWGQKLMQIGVYCLRQSRRSGFRKARDFDLPTPTLPHVPAWPAAVRQRCAWILSGGSDGTASASMYIAYMNWCNELVFTGYAKAHLRTQEQTAVTILEDFQRALDRDVSFPPSRLPFGEDGAATNALRAAANAAAAAGPLELIERTERSYADMQSWYEAVATAQREAIRGSPFFANPLGHNGSVAARRLHYLVQFMDLHLRQEEHRARDVARAASGLATSHDSATAQATQLAKATAKAGDVLSYGLSTLDDSPLIVLDFLGYLTSEGGWPMVSRAFCVCDTAFRVERRRHRHALAEVRETAVTAVLSQLRVVPAPRPPAILAAREPTRTRLLPTYLNLSLLQSACSLSDAVSRDGSLTLMGCARRDPVTAMLSNPSAEEQRSMLFGVKQVTVYVEAEAQRYRTSSAMPAAPASAEERNANGLAMSSPEDLIEADGDTRAALLGGAKGEGVADAAMGGIVSFDESYFNFMTANARSSDAALVALCEHYKGEFRIFAASLTAALDLNLEVVRHHGLPPGVMDADMGRVLSVSLSTLLKIFKQTAQVLMQELLRHEERTDAKEPFLFLDECAVLALVGLCVSASMAHVTQLDAAGVFFTGPVGQLSREVVDTTQALVASARANLAQHGDASLHPLGDVVARKLMDDRFADQEPGTAPPALGHGNSLLDGTDVRSYPTSSLLVRGLELLSRDLRLSRRVLLRFGVAQHRERHDLTAALLALYSPTSRTVNAAAAAASSPSTSSSSVRHQGKREKSGAWESVTNRALELLHGLWDGIRGELTRGGATLPVKGKQRTSKFVPDSEPLPVPSRAELRLVLKAFDEFDALLAGTPASARGWTWACGDARAVETMLSHVREVPSLISSETATVAPLALPKPGQGSKSNSGGSGEEEEFDDFDEAAIRTEMDGHPSRREALALGSGEEARRDFSHLSQSTVTWSSAFLTSFPCVSEVLAERDNTDGGDSGMSDQELIDAVIAQGGVVRRVYKGREKGSAPLMAHQLQEMKEDFGRNVMALLRAFPLSAIASRPNAADGFFSAFDVFINPANHAMTKYTDGDDEVAMAVTHTAASSSSSSSPSFPSPTDNAVRHKAQLKELQQCQALCELLEKKMTQELLQPAQPHFSQAQEDLLSAVRAERNLSASAGCGSDSGGGSADTGDVLLPHSMTAASTPAILLTRTADQLTRRALRQTSATEDPASSLSWQDDIRAVVQPRAATTAAPSRARTYANPLQPPAHLPTADSDAHTNHGAAGTALPLPVLMSLLRMVVNGDKNDPATRALAETAATYAMRQHVMLRPRLAGTALNVLPSLHPWARSRDPAQRLSPREVQLMLDWRLPLKSAYVDTIAGRFFAPAQREAFLTQYAAATGTSSTAHDPVDMEQLVFEYIRSGALYLHLLSVTSALLYKFEIYGDLRHDEVSSLKRRYMQLVKAAKLEQGRRDAMARDRAQQRGVRRGPLEQEPTDAATAVAQFTGRESMQRELLAAMLQRQTTAAGVNANLLESAMLHFLNVSCVLLRHTDTLTHLAVDRTITVQQQQQQQQQARRRSETPTRGGDGHPVDLDETTAAFTAYASELRVLVVAAFQDSVTTVMHQSDRAAPLSLAHRVLNYIVSSTPCGILTEQQLFASTRNGKAEQGGGGPSGTSMTAPTATAATSRRLSPLVETGLRRWRGYRPEWFSCSPTMLAVISPHYFIRCLANSVRLAPSETITTIATCFTFYAQRSDMGLAPLLSATTELLTATPVRNTALTLYCEHLSESLLQREEFRQALAPPTIASRDQGAAGSVSNEVLVPFLAAMARHDVRVSKTALAALLHTVMRGRAEVFGQPPIPDRQSARSVAKVQSTLSGGAMDVANPLHTTRDIGQANGVEAQAKTQQVVEDEDDVAVLDTFAADAGVTARTHRRGLSSLNLSLPAAMEVAGHMRAMRRPSYEEVRRAKAMLRAADDARRERIAVYRAHVHLAQTGPHFSAGQEEMSAAAMAKLDASLVLEDPQDYGVAILHLEYAMRKIVHASFRRLAGSQSARVVAEMMEMLLEADEPFHRWWRAQQQQQQQHERRLGHQQDAMSQVRARRREALGESDPVAHSGSILSVATAATAALSAASGTATPPRDTMLARTLRLLVNRALTCALAVGYADGAPLLLPAAVADSTASVPLLLPPTSFAGRAASSSLQDGAPGSEVARGEARVAAESSASATLSSSMVLMSHRARQRVLRALASVRHTNRLRAVREANLNGSPGKRGRVEVRGQKNRNHSRTRERRTQ